MKNYLWLISLLLFMLSSKLVAQSNKAMYQYSVGYFGNNLWNEGINVGLLKERYTYPKTNKRGKACSIVKSHVLNIGFYNDSGSHLGLFATAGWGHKKVFPKRWQLHSLVQPIGLMRSFLPETYRVTREGEIRKSFLPGRLYLSPSISTGFGRVGKRNPLNGWYARTNLMVLLPCNNAILPLVNLEFGAYFTLKTTKK